MKILNIIISLGLFLVANNAATAQTPPFEWANIFGANNVDRPESITIDNNGYIYATGRFKGTVDFDPGPSVNNITSQGNYDIFVIKLNPTGDLVWVKTMGGSSTEYGIDLAVDAAKNVFVTGKFKSTVDFDPGTGQTLKSSNGDRDIFIMKLTSSGNLSWVNTYGAGGYDTGHSIDLDNNSNVFITGKFFNTVDFDPSPTSSFTLSATSSADIFVQKLDSSGNHLWAYSFGDTGWDTGRALTVDNNDNVIITGDYANTIDFNPDSSTTHYLTSNGSYDYFVLKLDPNGSFIWGQSCGGSSVESSKSICTDKQNNIYITGSFNSTADFDPDTSTYNLQSNGQKDIFLQKLDSTGALSWAHSFGSNYDDVGREVHASSNQIFLTGFFQDTIDLDPSINQNKKISNGNKDVMVLALDSAGSFNWAESFGSQYDDLGWSIVSNMGVEIYTTGCFKSSVDFDPGNSTHWETSSGNYDIFIQKLGQAYSTSSIIDTACTSYTVPSGDETYYSSGSYYDTIPMTNGGDSIIDINITIIDIDTTVINSNNVLTAVESGVIYQWVKCENWQPIPGETNQTFIPPYNDGYAVIITKWNCVDTSSCHWIKTLGVKQHTKENLIITQPNPAKNFVTINAKQSLPNMQMKIIDINGQVIKKDQFDLLKGNDYRINVTILPAGVYLMTFENKKLSFSKKLLIYN